MPRPLSKPFLAFSILAPLFATTAWAGPYPPAAGQPGTDAIAYNDPRFVEWASGYQNYLPGNPINKSFEDPTQTLGPAKDTTTGVTELGDGGQITLTFANPIVASANGGPEFAVFGNAFGPGYLKLAYVDVSQDGVTWYRMPDDSLTPYPGSSNYTFLDNMDASNIYGLAGKYALGYGTPFRLSEVGLTSASYVRLVDVVGDGSNLDSAGNPIYDPWPNDNGFNAAGVGVLSEAPTVVPEPRSMALMLVAGGIVAIARQVRSRRASRRRIPEGRSMNRWMIGLLTLGLAQAANADLSTSTFEDLNPSQVANFVNSNAGATPGTTGYFVSGGNSFNNVIDPTYGTWSGFAISSQTNVANPGTGSGDYNYQFLAATGMLPPNPTTPIPAAGADNSLTYAVGFTYPFGADPFHPSASIVNLAPGSSPVSVEVTNTAYDVLSMTYGDGIGKVFGPNDFLKLTIQGYSLSDGQGSAVGKELDFCLASNGSIVTTWHSLDLSQFVGAASLVFGLESSDNDPMYGINTPAEFALDNLTVSTPSVVPEPSSFLLCLSGIGIGSLVLRRVRSRKGPFDLKRESR